MVAGTFDGSQMIGGGGHGPQRIQHCHHIFGPLYIHAHDDHQRLQVMQKSAPHH